MAFLVGVKLMKWLSKAPTVVLSQGWLAIYISIFVLIPLLSFGFIPLSVMFDLDAEQLALLILSAAPVFAVGLAEDLGYEMSPKARLIASAASSFFAILLFKVWLESLGIPGVDMLLMFAPFGILFTIFATVGVVNAFNLIDGLNGLSSSQCPSRSHFQLSPCAGNIQISIFFGFNGCCCLGVYGVKFSHGKNFGSRWRLRFGSFTRMVGDYSDQQCN